ncbi:TRAP transporter small permease [Bacilliculturomica massiliensis]|uniref:TRAP transporter small permease n=1 Tax=Bacilliculturomica massiliensis TaxID=1917867 RepID=UPI0013EF581F|nr:TRAP transporter small permease subunit [Bacilliculturomica massiliensis]
MKKMKPIEEWFLWRVCEKLMRYILIFSSAVLIVVVGAAVFARYCMDGDFFGSDEIITLFAMWVYWLGGAYGSYEASHISADLTNLFVKSEKVKKVLQIIVNALTTCIAGVLAYWSVVYYAVWNIQTGATTPGLGIPLLASNSAITVSLCLMFLYSLYHLVRVFIPRADSAAQIAGKGETA